MFQKRWSWAQRTKNEPFSIFWKFLSSLNSTEGKRIRRYTSELCLNIWFRRSSSVGVILNGNSKRPSPPNLNLHRYNMYISYLYTVHQVSLIYEFDDRKLWIRNHAPDPMGNAEKDYRTGELGMCRLNRIKEEHGRANTPSVSMFHGEVGLSRSFHRTLSYSFEDRRVSSASTQNFHLSPYVFRFLIVQIIDVSVL